MQLFGSPGGGKFTCRQTPPSVTEDARLRSNRCVPSACAYFDSADGYARMVLRRKSCRAFLSTDLLETAKELAYCPVRLAHTLRLCSLGRRISASFRDFGWRNSMSLLRRALPGCVHRSFLPCTSCLVMQESRKPPSRLRLLLSFMHEILSLLS